MKDNAFYEVVGEKEVPQNRHILKDQLIELRGLGANEKCPYPLRRIKLYDPGTDNINISQNFIGFIFLMLYNWLIIALEIESWF